MMQPMTITMPMELTVLPKPLLTDAMILSSGIPEHNPYPMAAMMSARNGCSLNFVVETTMKAIARMSSTISIRYDAMSSLMVSAIVWRMR